MNQSFTTQHETLIADLDRLILLVSDFKLAVTIEEKISILNRDKRVWEYCAKTFLPKLSLEEELIVKSIVAIGQASIVFSENVFSFEANQKLMKSLLHLEQFYQEIGGIVGYHLALVQFLCRPKKRFSLEKAHYHAPLGYDLSSLNTDVKHSIYNAIEKMDEISEMYPVGGAADRLKLQHPGTKESLPAALLMFQGKTMLSHLIEDVQAREYLYYKIKGSQINIPIAMMTSQEKDNHQKITNLCEESNWFFRPKGTFAFFSQPLVPVVDKLGNWISIGPMQLLLKPGGHGVIWKLARDTGVIDWLKKLGAKKAIVRQINNPVSSEDYGLLAFSGYGLKENRRFGFASCERQVKASEGINVIVEEELENEFSYTLTNIEYCDFETYGIEDTPVSDLSKYSKFPSNTNLLFVDLDSILEALKSCPIPGMLANFKKVGFQTTSQEEKEEEIGRLESTMQNIADCFSKSSKERLQGEQLLDLDAYITFNKRNKTISTTKKEYTLGSNLLETPEGCFLDVLQNRKELLEVHCHFKVPDLVKEFINPSFLFYYHPSLGPLYSIIGQKIQRGSFALESELHLEIAECEIQDLSLEGSLKIVAENLMGEVDNQGILRYSERVGRCILKNVSISNKGIDKEAENFFSRGKIYRKECCSIVLQGCSELFIENVTLSGDMQILVEDGWKMTIREVDGKIVFNKEKIQEPSWYWKYSFSSDYTLQIEKHLN